MYYLFEIAKNVYRLDVNRAHVPVLAADDEIRGIGVQCGHNRFVGTRYFRRVNEGVRNEGIALMALHALSVPGGDEGLVELVGFVNPGHLPSHPQGLFVECHPGADAVAAFKKPGCTGQKYKPSASGCHRLPHRFRLMPWFPAPKMLSGSTADLSCWFDQGRP